MHKCLASGMWAICLYLFFFNACGRSPGDPHTFSLGKPFLPVGTRASIYTGFIPIHISVRVEGPDGFLLQDVLQNGSNTLTLPKGSVKITVGYLAEGLKSGETALTRCANKSNNNADTNTSKQPSVNQVDDEDSVFYTQTSQSFNIDESTASITLNFPEAFRLISTHFFGFRLTNADGSRASFATVRYHDPISNQPILDPCTGTPFFDTADSQGRAVIDLPVWDADGLFGLSVTNISGKKQVFTPKIDKNKIEAQFFSFQMDGSAEGLSMSDKESFLDDGISIQERMNRKENPRYKTLGPFLLSNLRTSNTMATATPLFSVPTSTTAAGNSIYLLQNLLTGLSAADFNFDRRFYLYCRVVSSYPNTNTQLYPTKSGDYANCSPYLNMADTTIFPSGCHFAVGCQVEIYLKDKEGYNATNCTQEDPCSSSGPIVWPSVL